MENLYNDEMLPDDFEQIARAYAHKMKENGFVFIKLEDEEKELLTSEIFVAIAKMKACLERLKNCLQSDRLMCRLENAEEALCERFSNKKPHKFTCVANENDAFLSLISIENTLVIKLMLLSIKTEEYELCNGIITGITSIFAESFSQEGFIVNLT